MRLLLVCVLFGCGRIGFDPGTNTVTDGDPACTLGPFGPAVSLSEFTGGPEENDPAETSDGLQMFLSYDMGGNDFELLTATRAGVAAPFGPPTILGINSPAKDNDPTLSGDGLRLLFLSERSGAPRIYEATRSSDADTFTGSTIPLGLEDSDAGGVDMTPNALVAYFTNGASLYRAERTSVTTPFTIENLGPTPGAFPSISSDELELFTRSEDGLLSLQRQTRASTAAPFGSIEIIDFGHEAFDAELLDQTHLLFSGDLTLYLAERTCQ